MTQQHTFVAWIAKQHGQDQSPIGELARMLHTAPEFPTKGGRKELRAWLQDAGVDRWQLHAFDQAWTAHKVPTCLSPGCNSPRAGGASSYCRPCGGRPHLSDGT